MDRQIRSTLMKGITQPKQIPGYLYKNWILSGKTELHRLVNRVERQKQLIEEFVNLDEFVLIILDSCRYDYFNRVYSKYLEGNLFKVWSSACWTVPYVRNTWTNSYDLTYISAAPYVSNFPFQNSNDSYRTTEHISNIVDVWRDHDERLGVVTPENLTEVALDYAANLDQTRLVVHYMQPHAPYIGDKEILPWGHNPTSAASDSPVDESSKKEFLQKNSTITRREMIKYDIGPEDFVKYNVSGPSIRDRLENGDISIEDLKRAYADNLDRVLQSVEKLVRRIPCDVAVTADHGELLGENERYGHGKPSHPVLREVPWLEIDTSMTGTRGIDEDRKIDDRKFTQEVDIEEHLEELGYK